MFVVPINPSSCGDRRLTGTLLRNALRPAERRSVFEMEGWLVWCGTAARTADGRWHLLFSRWPRECGHDGWVTHSEVGYAVADDPCGPYRFQHIVMGESAPGRWDAQVVHNPTLLEHDGQYYLYYTGNHGDRAYWTHRNQQRIGLAVADHPAGPWRRLDRPILDVSLGAWDGLMVSNPTVARGPDGRFCMVYKGVADGPRPKGGAVLCGVAFADHPAGPFVKHPTPIISNPEHDWAVEDPFVWTQAGRYYCLVKDFQGYFARSERNVLVLFESPDGIHWRPADEPLFMDRTLRWADGAVQKLNAMERPQILLDEAGRPGTLLLACAADERREISFNIQIGFDWAKR